MSTSTFASSARRAGGLLLVATVLGLAVGVVSTQRPHFYPDDPIAREPESQDASKAQPYSWSSLYEMTTNLFVTAGHEPSGESWQGRRR